MRLILGSTSPRRKEILGYFSLPFEQASPDFDESSILFTGNPEEYVSTLARSKALALSDQFPDAAILSADTIVYRHGKVYGKPQNEKEVFKTLSELSGNWHSVYTSVALWHEGSFAHRVEETRVLFNDMNQQQIQNYNTKLHLYDKAGSYQLQMSGGLIVNKIDGCYYNVIGLPINSVRSLLQKLGIDLWDYLQ